MQNNQKITFAQQGRTQADRRETGRAHETSDQASYSDGVSGPLSLSHRLSRVINPVENTFPLSVWTCRLASTESRRITGAGCSLSTHLEFGLLCFRQKKKPRSNAHVIDGDWTNRGKIMNRIKFLLSLEISVT